MILFIAPNPHKAKEHEGYLQRVMAIDSLFTDETKVYFDDLLNSTMLAKHLVQADMVYVHSIYQAEKILTSYPLLGDKIVTDLHGAVPEEVAYMGNSESAKRLESVESEVFKHGNKFVAVSDAMVTHYTKKYKLKKDIVWIVLPIFTAQHQRELPVNKKSIVVYAGGTQKWQNVDLMVEAINNCYRNYKFEILTHDTVAFSRITQRAMDNVEITSVPGDKVFNYYKDACLGFMLRDDITINNVACPTKLIEYLEYGVVPIILTPRIGDFQKLGYSFVELKDFTSNKISLDALKKAAANNFEVINKLKKKSNGGSAALVKLYIKMKKKSKPANYIAKLQTKLIENSCKIDELQGVVFALKEQIDYQNKLLKNYEESSQFYKKTLEDILNSRRWRAMETILIPLKLKTIIKK